MLQAQQGFLATNPVKAAVVSIYLPQLLTHSQDSSDDDLNKIIVLLLMMQQFVSCCTRQQ
jgi:hypothetical protein